MAARGAWSKEQVWNKILETFPGSFVNEKEIRIPMIENGDRIEIKVTLTAAKTNVGGNACKCGRKKGGCLCLTIISLGTARSPRILA